MGIEEIRGSFVHATLTDGKHLTLLAKIYDKESRKWSLMHLPCKLHHGDEHGEVGVPSVVAKGSLTRYRSPLLQFSDSDMLTFAIVGASNNRLKSMSYRTMDSGKTWSTEPLELIDDLYPEDALRIPLAGATVGDHAVIIYMAIKPGTTSSAERVCFCLSRSKNQGQIWERGTVLSDEMSRSVGLDWTVRCDSAGNTIAASYLTRRDTFPSMYEVSLIVSTDAGMHWRSVPLDDRFDGQVERNAVAVSPDEKRVLFATDVYNRKRPYNRHQLVVQQIDLSEMDVTHSDSRSQAEIREKQRAQSPRRKEQKQPDSEPVK